MKNTILILATSVFMIGCNGEKTEEEAKAQEMDSLKNYDVEYVTLHQKSLLYYLDKDGTQLFSGTAGTKNSSDELTRYAEFKNGYITLDKEWSEMNGKMTQTKDLLYKDGIEHEGYYAGVIDKDFIRYTALYTKYENGKEIDKWHLSLYSSYPGVSYLDIKGNEVCSGKGIVSLESYNREKDFIDCVKSKDIPFFYMEIKE